MMLKYALAALAAFAGAAMASGDGAQAQAADWRFEEGETSCAMRWTHPLNARAGLTLMQTRPSHTPSRIDRIVLVAAHGVTRIESGSDVMLRLPNGDERTVRALKSDSLGADVALIYLSRADMSSVTGGFYEPGEFALIDPSGAEPQTLWRFTHVPVIRGEAFRQYNICNAGLVVAASAAAQP
ncbi:MAG: hypothetical protein JJU18_07890 [Oceanicaulis sp.]|nr:hypothetical protein [Oceanicaulis sp.]